ncbi:MAG TPA: hypothetical protein VGJ72_13030 [Polaromonas sp.]
MIERVHVQLFKKYQPVRMPNLELGTDDVASLLSYLEVRSRANAAPQAGKQVGREAAAAR